MVQNPLRHILHVKRSRHHAGCFSQRLRGPHLTLALGVKLRVKHGGGRLIGECSNHAYFARTICANLMAVDVEHPHHLLSHDQWRPDPSVNLLRFGQFIGLQPPGFFLDIRPNHRLAIANHPNVHQIVIERQSQADHLLVISKAVGGDQAQVIFLHQEDAGAVVGNHPFKLLEHLSEDLLRIKR